MRVPRSARRRRFAAAGLVTLGSLVANAAAYLLHLPASRWLGPEGYGAFAALLAAQLLVAVPALALQNVVARDRVRGAPDRELRGLGARVALLVAVVAAVALWPVAALVDTPVAATAAALASGPVLCLVAAEQGLLQGRERFAGLGATLALVGVAKVAPAVAVLAAGGGLAPTFLAGAAGLAAAWLACRLAVSRLDSTRLDPTRHDRSPHDSTPHTTTPPTAAEYAPGGVAAVLAAGQVQLVMIALTSVDVVVSRALLDEADAGRYALGAVAAKAAFWLPAAVGTVLYPRMADAAAHRGAIRTAVGVLLAIGAVVVGAAALAAPLVPAVVGADYRPVAGLLWAFALVGVVLSVLQALLLWTIATERTAHAWLAWAGLGVTLVAIWCAPRTVGGVLSATAAGVVVTTCAVALRARLVRSASGARPSDASDRRPGRSGADDAAL